MAAFKTIRILAKCLFAETKKVLIISNSIYGLKDVVIVSSKCQISHNYYLDNVNNQIQNFSSSNTFSLMSNNSMIFTHFPEYKLKLS